MFNYKIDSEFGNKTNTTKLTIHIVLGVVLLIVGVSLLFGSWTTINADEEAVVLRVGKVDRTLGPGFHWKTPFIEDVIKMNARTIKQEVEASAASEDLQDVTTQIAIQYHINRPEVGEIYPKYGKSGIRSTVVDPALQDAIKTATGQFTAEHLVTNRLEVKGVIEGFLRERFNSEHITLVNVDVVNFTYSPTFTTSIEKKVTAEQDALAAENKLAQVEFEAQQKIATAQAEAEAIRIQAQAINSQGGEDYVELQRIEAWNGEACTSYCGLETSTGLLISR